jgi:steroid 5-alpha reductase family enzyme
MILIYSLIGLVALFGLTWWVASRINNYSIVDAVWSLSFAGVAGGYIWFGEGWVVRKALVGGLVILWSLRLGLYLSWRISRHHPQEDKRYSVLRNKWQSALDRNFLLFFEVQGFLVWFLMMLVYGIIQNKQVGFLLIEWVGLLVFIVSIIGEGIADEQLKQFKAKRHRGETDKEVCDEGLWGYSRHPNYFFQSLLWWGLALICSVLPYGWLGFLAPLVMSHFLMNVTGIPLTETLAVESKGEEYVAYQKRVRPFFLWKKKSMS